MHKRGLILHDLACVSGFDSNLDREQYTLGSGIRRFYDMGPPIDTRSGLVPTPGIFCCAAHDVPLKCENQIA